MPKDFTLIFPYAVDQDLREVFVVGEIRDLSEKTIGTAFDPVKRGAIASPPDCGRAATTQNRSGISQPVHHESIPGRLQNGAVLKHPIPLLHGY